MNKIIEILGETIEILESAFTDKKELYKVIIHDGSEHGRVEYETREEHLETLIDIAVQQLGITFDDLKNRELQKQKLKALNKKK